MQALQDIRMPLAAVLLLCMLLAALARIARGPTRADRLMVTQLFGTCGAAILLVQSAAMEMPALVDVALLLVLLSAVVMIAFTLHEGGDRA
jgi:multicomponent Na+:H+ antiporter subunit F